MILVTGATGFIGRSIVSALLERGYDVRILLPRGADRDLPWAAEAGNTPEIVTGGLFDEEAVFVAVNGVYTIIHLENAFWWGGARDLERIEVVGTRNLVVAARAARVGRIIAMSHLGASPASAFTLHKTKGQVEDLIRTSGLAFTIIRTGIVFGPQDAFVNHIAMALSVTPIFFPLAGRGEVNLHPVYIDDLIEAVIRSLRMISIVDQVIEIGGAEYLSLEDLLRTIMRVNRTPRILIRFPPYIIRLIVRLMELIFPRSLITRQWLDILAANRVTHIGNMYRYFGIHPRRFEDTLLTYMPDRRYFWQAFRYVIRRRPRES